VKTLYSLKTLFNPNIIRLLTYVKSCNNNNYQSFIDCSNSLIPLIALTQPKKKVEECFNHTFDFYLYLKQQ
jgi:hypothetical protein